MEEYKPTRLSYGNFKGSCIRSLSISFTTEVWQRSIRDYYIHIRLWKYYFKIVILRLNKIK